MNIAPYNATVTPGFYEAIVARGQVRFDPGVSFATLVVDGNLLARSLSGERVVCQSGSIQCNGNMSVRHIQGRGEINIDGLLRCDHLELVGRVCIGKGLISTGTIKHVGLLRCPSIWAGKSADLCGSAVVNAFQTESLVIRPLHMKLFVRLDMWKQREPILVESLSCRRVVAQDMHSHLINADNIHLSGSCRVDRAIYREELCYGRDSRIGRITFDNPNLRTDRRCA